MADPEWHDENGNFKKGNKGGPGRKGVRQKFADDFIADIHKDWQEHGAEVLEICREKHPAEYLKALTRLMPREAKLDINTGDTFVRLLEQISAEGRRLRQGNGNAVDADFAEVRTLPNGDLGSEGESAD